MKIKVDNHLTPNFLEMGKFVGNGTPGATELSGRDLIAAQALTLCDTDQIVAEVTNRLRPSETHTETVLASFKTDMLLTELTYRAQNIALVLIEAQNMIAMSEFLLSGHNLFQTSSFDLDGYKLASGSNDG